MSIPKPLTAKTLAKRYGDLNIKPQLLEQLSTYFDIFSNLYGIISISDAYGVYSSYEPKGVKKGKFRKFAEVAARDVKPYVIVDVADIFDYEKGKEMLLVNRKLIAPGYNRWVMTRHVYDCSYDHSLYLPDKEELFEFETDTFWSTAQGIRMSKFIKDLKSSGIGKDKYKNTEFEITDIHGESARDRKLKNLVVITELEQFMLDYYKKGRVYEKIRDEAVSPVADKVLGNIESNIRCQFDPGVGAFSRVVDDIVYTYGVSLTEKQLQRFMELYMDLNNYSNLWALAGASPNYLFQHKPHNGPLEIEIGKNMQQMMEEGIYSREELEQFFKENGIRYRYK